MVDIPSNFCKSENNKCKCMCGVKENMQHIYECENLNIEKTNIRYEKIFTGNTEQQRKILERFEKSLENRETYIQRNKSENDFDQVILSCDQLFSVSVECGNG